MNHNDPRIGSSDCHTVKQLYRHYRERHDVPAVGAFRWAKGELAERKFWRRFECQNDPPDGLEETAEHDLDRGFGPSEDATYYTPRCGTVCILLARANDEDYRGNDELSLETGFAGWHAFCREESDKLSLQSEHGRRNDNFYRRTTRMADVRREFDEAHDYARKSKARHDAWRAAYEQVTAMLAEATREDLCPEGFLCAVYYRTGPDTWERYGDADSCWGFVDYSIQSWAWENGIARDVKEARKLSRGYRAARAFAGVES
jgi:hypothetical protein